MNNIINFGDSSTPAHARTPASRGRGKASLSHSQSHSHTSSSPPSGYMSNMDIGPRSERAPKPGLTHSFTFSTPQPNPRATGRKRARTLEYPTDTGDAGDDAKVKGGHSLRKRVRIDYAQMNNEDDTEVPTTTSHVSEDQQQITVSGAARPVRAARRKTVAGIDNNEETEEQQPSSSSVAQKKTKAPKQRTASPGPPPPKRTYTKRKSTATSVAVENPSPEQQPSDTELKDTIEVGAPLAMQFTSSSSNSQPSDTTSVVSGQSPSQNGSAQQVAVSQTEVNPPTIAKEENQPRSNSLEASDLTGDLTKAIARVSPSNIKTEQVGSDSNIPLEVDAVRSNTVEVNGSGEVEDNNTSDLASLIQNALQVSPDIVRAADLASEATQTSAPSDFHDRPLLDDFDNNLLNSTHNLDVTSDFLPLPTTSAPAPGSSQESIDSDTTEILPPEGPGGTLPSQYQTERQPPSQGKPRLTLRSKLSPTTPRQQDIMAETQDSQKPSLRPRVSIFINVLWHIRPITNVRPFCSAA